MIIKLWKLPLIFRIFLLVSMGSVLSANSLALPLSCFKSQSAIESQHASISKAEIDSRIEALAKQILYIRLNQFSDPEQRLPSIYYIETESRKLKEMVPDLNQRLTKAIRMIKPRLSNWIYSSSGNKATAYD